MNKYFFILFFLFYSYNVFSQDGDLLDKIAEESCKCINNDISFESSLTQNVLYMKLGSCLLKKSLPYKKEISEKYNINLESFGPKEGNELGKLVGVRLVKFCPDFFSKIANTDAYTKKDNFLSVKGQIKQVKDGDFVEVVINSPNTKMNLLWLEKVDVNKKYESNIKLLKDKEVIIYYVVKDFFNFKEGIYTPYNIIKKIEIAEE